MHLKKSLLNATVAMLTMGSAVADQATTSQPAGTEVRDNVIVACLLPARVRKLGNMVYPERRRLTETTAKKCELRGGEYTTYDRSRPEGAVAFFLPLANDGDASAQVNLGEVYEFLLQTPDYAQAAFWYKKGVEQDDPTAMRRLAHLYELGLGVEKDPLLATNLWRKGIGTDESLVLASTLDEVKTAAEERIEALTHELRDRNADIETLGRDLVASRTDLANRKAALAASVASIAQLKDALASVDSEASKDAAESKRLAQLELEIAQRQRTIDEQRFQIESKQIVVDAQNAQLTNNLRQADLENNRLKAELSNVTAKSNEEMERSKQSLASRSAEVAILRQQQTELTLQLTKQRQSFESAVGELKRARANVDSSNEALARAQTLETEQQRQSAALADSEAKAHALAEQLSAAEVEAQKLQVALDEAAHERSRMEAQIATTESSLVATRRRLSATETELNTLETQLALTRQERDSVVKASQQAPAEGPEAVRLRGELATKNAAIAQLGNQLEMVITQRKELNAENELLKLQHTRQVATRSVVDPLPDTSSIRLPKGIEIGRNYAIVIGNNTYQNLRPLTFAQSDARKVNDVLESRYGFTSQLLLDVTADQILQHFEAIDEKLQPADSLIVYFAGHGVEQDRSSYWLGVNAPSAQSRLDSYGVSTDVLNHWLSASKAKHILVVADSCYAGAGIVSTGGIKFNAGDVNQHLKFSMGGRSRTVISSGGNDPTPDGGAGDGSVFTKVFIGLLNENRGVLIDGEMFAHLKERVMYGNDGQSGIPTPVFARIEVGGHVAGQFVFVHPSVRT